MKFILLLFSILYLQTAQGQKKGIEVTLQNQTIKVDLQDENPGKTLAINSKLPTAKTGKLSVFNPDWANEKEWKRSFEIYNDADQSLASLTACRTNGKYEVPLNRIVPKMIKGNTYYLYTIAIPKDPKKAAVVRVRRVLACTITIN